MRNRFIPFHENATIFVNSISSKPGTTESVSVRSSVVIAAPMVLRSQAVRYFFSDFQSLHSACIYKGPFVPPFLPHIASIPSIATFTSATEKEEHSHFHETKGNNGKSNDNADRSNRPRSESEPFLDFSTMPARLRQWVLAQARNVDYSAISKTLREEFVQVFSAADAAAAARQQPSQARSTRTDAMSDRTELVLKQRQESAWERRWGAFRTMAADTPAARKLREFLAAAAAHPVAQRGAEFKASLEERWETSDSPIVDRIKDWNEALFAETEVAATLRIIKERQPGFSVPEFLVEMTTEVRPVIQAYLRGDLEALSWRCRSEMLERCRGVFSEWNKAGAVQDTQILHVDDVELLSSRLIDDEPILVLGFCVQQINCVRDKAGSVIEGAPDDIQTVHYAWAVAQNATEQTDRPRWQIREMLVRGIQAIL